MTTTTFGRLLLQFALVLCAARMNLSCAFALAKYTASVVWALQPPYLSYSYRPRGNGVLHIYVTTTQAIYQSCIIMFGSSVVCCIPVGLYCTGEFGVPRRGACCLQAGQINVVMVFSKHANQVAVVYQVC
jgi:hypothetical protein